MKKQTAEEAVRHVLTMETQDEPRMFRAVCSCGGFVGQWETTNACMGRGRRHIAAMKRQWMPGDRALHRSNSLDARPVEAVEGKMLRLRIGTMVTDPVPASNYWNVSPRFSSATTN